ncbi:U6 snRNP-associated protein Lsm7 [Malassezia arunalokei]|uniref:U6 snRNP-associated protein Lsm7 n=1 Tax=Malassezia arunalokei TaxID=1514897 RepID=A0AAJ6CMU7_9BASI|nr:U6 snRNP-associated protein Lsm7 [Malassezia arunalokei]
MSDRQGQGHRSSRGGGRGGHSGRGGGHVHDKPKKEAILNLAKYVDKQIRVKFMGNREAVVGTLKGYDQLMNLVMDDVEELLHDPSSGSVTGERRTLGLAVLRGTNLMLISPVDGFDIIEKYV